MKRLRKRATIAIIGVCGLLGAMLLLGGCEIGEVPGTFGSTRLPASSGSRGTVNNPNVPPIVVATVLAEGNNVFITRASGQRTALSFGQKEDLRNGDEIATGAASGALVTFTQGDGHMELDENTDPSIFEDIKNWIHVKILKGIVHFDSGSNPNFDIDCGDAQVFLRSIVNIKVERNMPSTVTLLSGEASIVLKANRQTKSLKVPGEQAVVSRTNIRLDPKPLTSIQLQEISRWQLKFPTLKKQIERQRLEPVKPLVPSRTIAPRVPVQ
jgi:hypothetical protein